uniref:G-protein coupled receptors family 1 profile domain-containing protein n=1 Tax=Globodera rostochiensis TaxID=31243 RepID=A0A914HYW7_GLORO
MASSVDPLYDLYMNKGFVPIEIVLTGIIAMICCVGIGLNSSLVYLTIKTKSLHSPCQILIALPSDRSYLSNLSMLNELSAYIGSSAHWEKPVMCTLGDPSNQPENYYFTNINASVIYCGEFLCYTLIWLIIWGQKSLIPENVKKLTLSLSVLMSIGLICYILNIFFIRVIMPLLNLDAFTIEYFVLPISFALQAMAYGSSAPVLYFCNGQYRSAFRTQFGHQANQVTIVRTIIVHSNP